MIEKSPTGSVPQSVCDDKPSSDAYDVSMFERGRDEILREQQEHGGQFFARTRDGRTALVYAATIPELDQQLDKLGLSYTEVVVGRVPSANAGEQVLGIGA